MLLFVIYIENRYRYYKVIFKNIIMASCNQNCDLQNSKADAAAAVGETSLTKTWV